MMQPAFLPWQGFFGLAAAADVFVLLDDFQFSVQSWHQRNRLFVAPGRVGWYSVPVARAESFGVPLDRARIDATGPWRRKMLARLRQNYSRAPFFDDWFPRIERWLATPVDSLAELNIAFIRLVLDACAWPVEIRRGSQRPSAAARSRRVLELLRWCDADCYLAARGSFGYMRDDGVFPVAGIEVRFQDYRPEPYAQIGGAGEFQPGLSVLDALFNVGGEETARRVRQGGAHWTSWKEMENAS